MHRNLNIFFLLQKLDNYMALQLAIIILFLIIQFAWFLCVFEISVYFFKREQVPLYYATIQTFES